MTSEKTYHGRPCKHCQSTLRYKSNAVCVDCTKKRSAAERNLPEMKASRAKYMKTEKGKAARRRYQQTEGYRASQVKYATEKLDNRRKATNEWGKRNRHKTRAYSAAYDAARRGAMPEWLTLEQRRAIEATYATATVLGLTVDHIDPLRGKDRCGLHVPWNLQLLTASENSRKSNRVNQ